MALSLSLPRVVTVSLRRIAVLALTPCRITILVVDNAVSSQRDVSEEVVIEDFSSHTPPTPYSISFSNESVLKDNNNNVSISFNNGKATHNVISNECLKESRSNNDVSFNGENNVPLNGSSSENESVDNNSSVLQVNSNFPADEGNAVKLASSQANSSLESCFSTMVLDSSQRSFCLSMMFLPLLRCPQSTLLVIPRIRLVKVLKKKSIVLSRSLLLPFWRGRVTSFYFDGSVCFLHDYNGLLPRSEY